MPIRTLTSIYWVARDLLRPFFRSSLFWLILVALASWYVLTGQAWAILLTDIEYNQSSYNPWSYMPIVPGVASIPSWAEFATNFWSARTPVYVKSNIWRREVYFPFMNNDWSNAGNVSITNSQWFFSLFFPNKNTDFDEVYDFNVWFTFSSSSRINSDTFWFSLVWNVPLYDQFLVINQDQYWQKLWIFLYDVTRKELYYYTPSNSDVYNLYTNYNLFNYLKNITPTWKRTWVTDFYSRNWRDPCTSVGKTFVWFSYHFNLPWQQLWSSFCADSTTTVTTPTQPLDLDTYLNVVLPQTDSSGNFETTALWDYAVCMDYATKIEQQINNLRNCETITRLNTYLSWTWSNEFGDIMSNYDWYDMTYLPNYTNKYCKQYHELQLSIYNKLLWPNATTWSSNRYVYDQTYLQTLNYYNSNWSQFSAVDYCSKNKNLYQSTSISPLSDQDQSFLDSITNFFNWSWFSLSWDDTPSYLRPFQNIKDKYFTLEQYEIIETQNFCLETWGKKYADLFLYWFMVTLLMSLFYLLNR